MKKLEKPISSNVMKIIELYNRIGDKILITNPDFQRKLVWRKSHKFNFIDTILMNYPFPEVYIASSEMNMETLKIQEVVVDGQQRLSTIMDYINSFGDFENQKTIPSFTSLEEADKRNFLNYPVSVKDLKDISAENIQEVFKRINSTDYSLNRNEIQNSKYGDSDFLVFSKILIDPSYQAEKSITSIVIDEDSRSLILEFFKEGRIFSTNDRNRMFDVQFLMLIFATILKEGYFSRSKQVDVYLEQYNESFLEGEMLLNKLIEVTSLIERLNLSDKSYWFNKANVFTLIVELSKFDLSSLNEDEFRRRILELELKCYSYFAEEEISISEDERQYFEVARQGSHELPARIHRGKVLNMIMAESRSVASDDDSQLSDNLKILDEQTIDFCIFKPTKTGLTKNILDATKSVREYFQRCEVHDFTSQENGPNHKVSKDVIIYLSSDDQKKEQLTLYKSLTRGDTRMWITHLDKYVEADNQVILFSFKENLYLTDISKENLSTFCF